MDMGVFTPTQVLVGGTDRVAYCQATVQEMFDEILHKDLLIWLDDLLGYHKTEVEVGLLTLLEKVLEVCAQKVLKLNYNPKKCNCLRKRPALSNAVELAHTDPTQRLNVFADASEHHWGAVVTQIPLDQLDRPLAEQDHASLMFLGGTFSGAAMRWTIIENVAFALVETCKRADFLLHQPGGFALFTDHRNLKFIFSPQYVASCVPKNTTDKIERWAILLMAYDFEITAIAGADNTWDGLLSRWDSPLTRVCAIRLVTPPKSPMLDDQFCWPTLESVAQAQATETPSIDLSLPRADDGIWRTAFGAGGYRCVQPICSFVS
ncbi:hypothetical protein PR001_g6858 [Phytophthora rubi]|uniref:Reverse transcriptase RNase H-like domain-containing protein n=1 Tax=Phytophthora rubi TaxID=129364 RepID=A0A6A3NH63_9STRA|nr:hypothetical protein PR001_g6858 [Phytophthora rubi]